MSRYKETKFSKKNRVKSYRTTIYESVPERNDDMYFIAQEGDRCDVLANQFYNDAKLWWFIARVNNLKTNNIPAGTSLRIPISSNKAKGF
jgi:hypothetical protein|tara:strand:- start:102 stop:371 length:270 start_codon:yes stop_codon:yes gene_type:complete